MNRSACVVVLIALCVALLASPALANIPDPALSVVPTFVTIAPDGGVPGGMFGTPIQVKGSGGGVAGAVVAIEFSEVATALIGWSEPIVAGADIPIQFCPTRKYVKVADSTGEVVFHIAGGGCLKTPDFTGATYVARITADGILLADREVNSPDAVDSEGRLPTGLNGPICDSQGRLVVSLADAVFHAGHLKMGTYEKCTDVAPPYGGVIDLSDAVPLTQYLIAEARASCYPGCP